MYNIGGQWIFLTKLEIDSQIKVHKARSIYTVKYTLIRVNWELDGMKKKKIGSLVLGHEWDARLHAISDAPLRAKVQGGVCVRNSVIPMQIREARGLFLSPAIRFWFAHRCKREHEGHICDARSYHKDANFFFYKITVFSINSSKHL